MAANAAPAPQGTDAIDITMLICTRNRAGPLASVLESATRLHVPESVRWELVVVDNGSSDGTAEVVQGFENRLPVRLVREDIPGLSNARNRGVSAARGRYICWTDDDVVIDENWLAAYARAFEKYPEAAVFGGRIIPVLQEPTPAWFGRLADQWPLTTVVAQRNCSDRQIPLDLPGGVAPWGANYAVRTAEQRGISYEPDLGVSPLQKRVGEEAEVIYHLLSNGATGWWVPDAQVRHIIPTHRQTLSYVFTFFTSNGETVRYLESVRPGRHHRSLDQRAIRGVKGSALRLYALVGLNSALFGLSWLVGAKRRGLYFLAWAGYYNGAARYAASATA
jgi:glycosyltransferase involved in cell wall biosynthesis